MAKTKKAARPPRRHPNKLLDGRGPKRLLRIERLDGKKPKPRDVAEELATMLMRLSKCQPKELYNRTNFRLTLQQFNQIRDRPSNAEVDDHYRNRLSDAGRDELIVIGVGDKVVIVTHDEN